MSETREMIDSADAAPSVAHAELADAIDAVAACRQAATACAMAMVQAGGMVPEVRRALDCADMCDATGRILSRGPATDPRIVAAVVDACSVACEASAEACGRHADHHEHCRLHSERAARCVESLRALHKSLTT